jgi:hypothetical protein
MTMRIPPIPSRAGGPWRRLALLAALLLCAGAAAPAPAHAQDTAICTGQSVPPGYAVVAAGNGQQCPGYYASQPNLLTLRLPGDTVSVCSAYTSSLPGYVVVAAGNGQQCPGYYASQPNFLALRLPGDTVTVCSQYTPSLEGYVVVSRGNSQRCPGYYASTPNSASYRRLPQAYLPAPSPAPADEGVLPWLDVYSRYALRRLRMAEGRLRLEEPTHGPWTGVMAAGGSARPTLEREAGVRHTLVAVCDQDCSSVTLRVMDPRGTVVAVSEAGTQPVVHLPPAVAGRWTLEASVRACAVQTCRFAVGVYEAAPEAIAPPRRPPPTRPRTSPDR